MSDLVHDAPTTTHPISKTPSQIGCSSLSTRTRVVWTPTPPCTDGCIRLSHMHPLWTWMCHHLGHPPHIVAAWVTHSDSRCDVSPVSGITHEVMYRVSISDGADAKHSVRSWFVHPDTSLHLVWFMMSGTRTAAFAGAHHSSRWLIRHWFMQHTRGGNIRDVVLHRTSRSPCLVDSEQPTTAHPVMGKTLGPDRTNISCHLVHVSAVPPPLHG